MKLDKSKSSASASKKILSQLRKDQKLIGEAVKYFIGKDDGRVILGIVDIEKGVTHSYTLDWDTAAFIGYCLFSESIKIAGADTAKYIMDLAERRQETTAALAFNVAFFKEWKDMKGGKE